MSEIEPRSVIHRIGIGGRIRIDLPQGSIRVDAVDGHECRVAARYRDHAGDGTGDPVADGVLRIDVSAGGLVISGQRVGRKGALLGRLIGGGMPTMDVTVDVPRSAVVAATSVRGDITTTGLTGRQAIRTVAGEVLVRDATGTVEVSTVSGGIAVQGVTIRPTLSTTSGTVTVEADRMEEARIDSVSGDIRLDGGLGEAGEHQVSSINGDLSLGCAGGVSINVRAVSGSIRSELAVRREDGNGRRRVVVGDGRAQVAFRTVSGNLMIRPAATAIRATRQSPDSDHRDVTSQAPDGDTTRDMLVLLEALERGDIDVEEASRRLEVTYG